MFRTLERSFLASLVCLMLAVPTSVAAGGMTRAEECVEVAGQSLTLNGTGIGVRLVFKVYAIALYLPAKAKTPEAILASTGPRRIVIAMLRDVSGADFFQAIADYLKRGEGTETRRMTTVAAQVKIALDGQAGRLRTGDKLTIDWIPGTGTVIELNQKRISTPVQEVDFYNALLKIWLGAEPADPALKRLVTSVADRARW